MDKKNCTSETIGTITSKDFKIESYYITVEYTVGENTYSIKEQVKYKTTNVKKILFIPIGYSAIPSIGNTEVGSEVKVMYDPNNPEVAYLPDNIGKRL